MQVDKEGLDFLCFHGHNVFSAKENGTLFDKQIWRVGDVAEFLGCSVGHIYNLVADEKIPKRKRGGLLVFVPEEILNWVLEGEQQ